MANGSQGERSPILGRPKRANGFDAKGLPGRPSFLQRVFSTPRQLAPCLTVQRYYQS